MMAGGRVFALLLKELTQFLRDRVMLFLVLYLYTAEVVMCTVALSFDVRNLPTVLADFAPEQQLRLPMRPAIRSLNLSNSVAITVYEAWRQIGFVGASSQ